MIELNLKNCRALVVGLGKSGIAASHLLMRSGAKVTATDSRGYEMLSSEAVRLSSLGVELEAGAHNMKSFASSDLIILSPGVPGDIPPLLKAREKGIKIIGELEFASQYLDIPVIAITGSNGKSTTTTLIGEILKAKGVNVFIGGNLGTPLSEFVLSGKKADCAVIEVSSFQLETIEKFRPYISILLNITPDHLDRYHDIKDYMKAKFRIFENQCPSDFTILNKDEEWHEDVLKMTAGRIIPFSRKKSVSNGIFIENGKMLSSIDGNSGEIIEIAAIGIKGVHNLENAMAAASAALVWKCSTDVVANTLNKFSGLEHRLEFVREIKGVKYINDSKGTNVGAVVKSLEGFIEPVLLIAGGRDKGSNFTLLRPLVQERVKKLILIGEARDKIKNAVGDLTETVFSDSLEEAVSMASRESVKGDVVLLSPACASFDMFRNFEERGRRFKEIVWRLP